MKTRIRIAFVLLLAAALSSVAIAQSSTPPPEPAIKVGSTAPDFTLTDQSGKQVSLHDFKGKKNVALAFYVFAFTGG